MTSSKRSNTSDHPHFAPLPSLFRICVAMGSTLDLGKLLRLILRLTMKELRAQQGSILLFDKTSDQLKMLASRGLPRSVTEKGYIPRKGSIAEWVISNDKPLLLNDVRGGGGFTSIARARPIRSALCVPLRGHGKVIGTININRTVRGPFTDQNLDTLTILATQAAVSIENARLHEERVNAERMATIGRTVAVISHGTKNVLTCLKGGVGIMEIAWNKKDWATARQGLELVKRSTDQIAYLVHDMLNYSKERTPERVWVDLPKLVGDLFASVSELARTAKVRLAKRIETASCSISADPILFHHALLNLVTNAIEAIRESSPQGGEVEVVAERAGADSPMVRKCLRGAHGQFDLIHVRDTGAGIPPQRLATLFQPFASSKGAKGTGLGLAVTQKIAREHGGDMVVESLVGQGTTFTMILPVIPPAPKEQQPAPTSPPQAPPTEGR